MNRRHFLTAIPAAVAALTASKSLAGATSPVDVSEANLVPLGRNGQRMIEGVWYCDQCDADTFPAGPRISDNHAIVRRGYSDMGAVWLDGERISDACIEAMAGEDGWVIVETDRRPLPSATDPAYQCPNCFGNMLEVIYGRVEIERWNGVTEFDGEAYRREIAPAVLFSIPPSTYVAPRGVE